MRLWGSKQAVIEKLAEQLEETTQELNLERAKRISAEALATERRAECDRAYSLLEKANADREAAVTERAKSLDLVNTALLAAVTPEKQPNIADYRIKPPEPHKLGDPPQQVRGMPAQAVVRARAADAAYMQHMLLHQQQQRKKALDAIPRTQPVQEKTN